MVISFLPLPLPFTILKCNSVNFPKREELLFLRVLAFPKASKMGLACKIFSSRFRSEEPSPTSSPRLTAVKYLIKCLQVSVLPAPDSPLTITDWSNSVTFRFL
eukprot:Lithocolla_globosa_v1_NODE_73_length_6890_cov_29.271982.p3 type:complete len:103 gc:universal NODE_73_length_6890_cov_29.271982:2219-1911(-)